MKFLLSLSAGSSSLPTPPGRFAHSILSQLGGRSPTHTKRGDKYTSTADDLTVTYDVANRTVTIKKGKVFNKQYPAPKIGERITPTQEDMAKRIGMRAKAEISIVEPAAGSALAKKLLKFKAKAPAKLTKEQVAEVKAKYSPAFAKKVVALGLALLAIKEVSRDNDETYLMFWPFKYGPATRKVKTAYGTLPRSDIFAMMGHVPSVTFKSVRSVGYKGYAPCRVCGVNLGADTQFASNGTQRPSGIAAHYKSHGINCNLIRKTVTDKGTGKKYAVMYVGSLNAL